MKRDYSWFLCEMQSISAIQSKRPISYMYILKRLFQSQATFRNDTPVPLEKTSACPAVRRFVINSSPRIGCCHALRNRIRIGYMIPVGQCLPLCVARGGTVCRLCGADATCQRSVAWLQIPYQKQVGKYKPLVIRLGICTEATTATPSYYCRAVLGIVLRI